MVNAGGQVAGLNTSALLRNMNLAIPIATVNRVASMLRDHGRGWRGDLSTLFLRSLMGVLPIHQIAPIRKGVETTWLKMINLKAMLGQFKIVDDFFLQQVTDIRATRNAVARKEFLGDAGPADDVTALYKQDAEASSCQIRPRDQAIIEVATL